MNDSKSQSSSPIGRFMDENSDALSFIGAAAMIFALLQILYFQFYVDSPAFYGYLRFCAELSTELLNLIGEPVRLVARTIISDAGPQVMVVEGCDALRIYSVLVAAILAYKAPMLKKVQGIIVGVGMMFIFNLVRISMLLWLDVHYTDLFDLFHHTVLPFGLWVIAILYFYSWGNSLDQTLS